MKWFRIGDYRVSVMESALPHDFDSEPFRPCYDQVLELREEGLVAIHDEHPEFQKADWEYYGEHQAHCCCIRVSNENEKVWCETGLIVPYGTELEKCVRLAGDNLFLMVGDFICLFAPDTARVIKQVPLRSGLMYAVYPYQQDFICHGELVILRVTKELKVLWQYSDGDGFVGFEMRNDRIHLFNLEGNSYEIDYDGRIL